MRPTKFNLLNYLTSLFTHSKYVERVKADRNVWKLAYPPELVLSPMKFRRYKGDLKNGK